MAIRLGDLLTQKELITRDQLEQALQAQSQLGGRLGTNLVEMGFVTEEQLATVLSEQLDIPFVDDSQVANIPQEIINQFPRELAEKYRAVPFLISGRVFCICMADPADLGKVAELRGELKTAIKPYVITEVALNYALDRYYHIPRERRLLSLSGAPSVASSFVRLALSAGELAGETPARAEEPPLDLDLGDELADTKNVTTLLKTLRRFAGTFWQRAALLGVRNDEVVGLLGVRLDVPPPALWRLKVEIGDDELLRLVVRDAQPVFRDNVDGTKMKVVCDQLGIGGNAISILPIFENRRVTAILLVEGGDNASFESVLPAARRFLAQVSCALQILTLRREILAQH